ncbi:hypothetical protein RIF29_41596 [Crotalaria pallida]|uniref:Uncharacterized protein n=1 Tax=Crotalaria pallida TaxID=3830 RepID=A0AAN9E604_CROPI
MSKAEAKMTKAADPERVNLLKTAPLCAGAGASDGVSEIDEGEMLEVAGASAAGDNEVDGGGEAVVVVGDDAGETELEDGDTAAGDGDSAFLVGDKVGDEAGD